MEKLTLEHIAPFGKGLHAKTKESKYKNPEIGIITSIQYDANIDEQVVISTGNGYYLSSVENTIPVFRHMDLTKPITIEGKEVIPLCEIFKNITDFESEIYKDINDNILGIRCGTITFQHAGGTIFILKSKDKVLPFNCKIPMNYLYSNKFDVEGLIDAGLAIDVNTLETNTYN